MNMREPIPFAVSLVAAGALLTGCGGESNAQNAHESTSIAVSVAPSSVPESSAAALDTTPVVNEKLAAYLPDWLDEAAYNQFSNIKIGEAIISFAIPDANGNVIAADPLGTAAAGAIHKLHMNGAQITEGIGGYGGDNASHAGILAGFKKGLEKPAAFAKSVASVAAETEQIADLPKGSVAVAIDFEYPNQEQAQELPTLVNELHKQGIHNIDMAVAAEGENAAPIQAVAKQLVQAGVVLHVMTYDENGPWSDAVGPLADGAWVKSSIANWVQAAGDATHIKVGLPTYCYQYVGVTSDGLFDADKTNAANADPVQYKDLPKGIIRDDMDNLTSSGVDAKGNHFECVSPAVAGKIVKDLRQTYPKLGAFVWDIRGLNKAYSDALQK
jgi:hypothetical protein